MILTDDVLYGRQALRNLEPWIVPGALDHLIDVVRLSKLDWEVFEWGAGGSTLWFAKHCAQIISIEQGRKWKDWADEKLAEHDLAEYAQVLYIPKDETGYAAYADAILAFDDKSFDLIFVDGERSVRVRCIENAIPKLKPGGILLVDNSNWLDILPDISLFDGWERHDFIAPPHEWMGEPNEWWTSFFVKPLEVDDGMA